LALCLYPAGEEEVRKGGRLGGSRRSPEKKNGVKRGETKSAAAGDWGQKPWDEEGGCEENK